MEPLNIKIWKYSNSLALIVLVIILSAYTWNYYKKYLALCNQTSVLRMRSAPFTDIKKSYNKLHTYHHQKPHPLTFIGTVSSVIPNEVHLVNYNYEYKKNYILMGKAKKYADIILFTQALQKISECSTLSLTHTEQVTSKEFNFTITIPLNE